jgi:hypothetical protein
VVTVQAIATGIARDVVGDEDPIPDFVTLNAISYFDDLSRNLVSQHQGSFFNAIPFHYITATDATGKYFHQYLARTDLWCRQFL